MFKKVEESQTLLINTQSSLLESQNRKIFKFGFGQSPFLPPQRVIDALSQASSRKEYTSVQGDLSLRKSISEFHFHHNGLNVQPENILLAPGSKILLFNILLAIDKADVYIPSPSWVSYAPQAKLAGHNIIKLETNFDKRWRITPAHLITAASKKKQLNTVLILNYPGNPDGLTYSENEILDLAKEARNQNIIVISDEIYGLLNHKDAHLSFSHYYPDRTITTTGLSKWCGAGGWRFGAAFLYKNIEEPFKKALIGIGSETYSCAPTPVQMAAKEAYDSYEKMEGYLHWQHEILSNISTYCSSKLKTSGIQVHEGEGGFYLFLDFSAKYRELSGRGIDTSIKLCEFILSETGVVLLPGDAFGFESNQLFCRLAYVDFDAPIELSTFNIIEDAPRVIEGIELLARWTTKLSVLSE